jgi:hypothetical protein
MYNKADIDFDGSVELADFSVLGQNWLDTADAVISNYSFEMADIPDGGISSTVSDWTLTGTALLLDPSAAQWTSYYSSGQTVPDGQQILSLPGGSVYQNTGELIVENRQYQLSAFVGVPLTASSPSAQLRLTAFDGVNETDLVTLNATVGLYTHNDGLYTGEFFALPLEKGKWVLQTASWDSSTAPDLVGRQLRVYVGGTSVHIDKVRLSGSKSVADFDEDGVVYLLDLLEFADNWLDY